MPDNPQLSPSFDDDWAVFETDEPISNWTPQIAPAIPEPEVAPFRDGELVGFKSRELFLKARERLKASYSLPRNRFLYWHGSGGHIMNDGGAGFYIRDLVLDLSELKSLTPKVKTPFEVGDTVRLKADYDPRIVFAHEDNSGHLVADKCSRWGEYVVTARVADTPMILVVKIRNTSFYAPEWAFAKITPGTMRVLLEEYIKRPPSERESKRLARRGRFISYIQRSGLLNVPASAVETKYLASIRGIKPTERFGPSSDLDWNLANFYQNAKQNLQAFPARVPDRTDYHRMLRGAPATWPRALDHVGEMVGVEMEFVTPHGYEPPDVLGLHLGTDGSVVAHQPDFTTAFHTEARLAFKYGSWARLERSCKALLKAGCVANASCGLHVHFDMRNRPREQVGTLARRLESALPFLNMLVPDSRVHGAHAERYCKQQASFDDRYSAINGVAYEKFGTLEIRMHSGSLNPGKIRRWIEVLHYLLFKTGPHIRSFEEFMCSDAPLALKKWSVRRFEQLTPPSEEDLLPAEPSETGSVPTAESDRPRPSRRVIMDDSLPELTPPALQAELATSWRAHVENSLRGYASNPLDDGVPDPQQVPEVARPRRRSESEQPEYRAVVTPHSFDVVIQPQQRSYSSDILAAAEDAMRAANAAAVRLFSGDGPT